MALFAGAANVSAFDGPFFSTGELEFSFDVIQFEGGVDLNVVEVIFAMNLSELNITTADSVGFDIDLKVLTTDSGKPLDIFEHHSVYISDSNSRGEFIDLKRFEIPRTGFSAKLIIRDSATGEQGVVEQSFKYRDLASSLSISDYVFVSHISKGDSTSQFSRHGLTMVPNPSRRFSYDQTQSNIYIYYEINNLGTTEAPVSSYDVAYIVRNSYGTPILDVSIPKLERTVSDISRVEKIALESLTPGAHYLEISVTTDNGNTATSTHSFQITDKSLSSDPMTNEEYLHSDEILKQLVTAKEMRRYKKLSPDGKLEFINRFWEMRDPTVGTSTNEYKLEVYKRYDYCMKQFRGGISSGRGRVYFKYGQPVDIERQFSSIGLSRPAEIWTYAQSGRTEFVFIDRSGDGTFILVHSNHRDEINNPGWRKELQAGN